MPRSTQPVLTLVIAVYNAVQYLEYIFAALERQTMKEFEVIIADDGSGPAMKELIDRVKKQVQFPIRHLWQEDHGFRKNKMLNKAIETSQTDYMAFIDGDCVPHREFLHDHAAMRQTGTLLCGRRMNLSSQLTDRVTLERIRSGTYEKLTAGVWIDGLLSRSDHIEDALRIENPFLRRLMHGNRARLLGCNFSIEKVLLEKINGFNEDYAAPGIGEDSDISFRLQLIGVQLLSLRFLAILYHLYHPLTKASQENIRMFEKIVAERNPVCRNGLKKLS